MTGLGRRGEEALSGALALGSCASRATCPRARVPAPGRGQPADGRAPAAIGVRAPRGAAAGRGVTEAPEDSGTSWRQEPVISLECAWSAPRTCTPGSPPLPSWRPGRGSPAVQQNTVWTDTESGCCHVSGVSCFLQASANPPITDRTAGVASRVRPGRGQEELMCRSR